MNSTDHQSASLRRGLLASRIAGAAVAAGLLLGAPLVTTLAVAPGVAVAGPLDIFDRCLKPIIYNDCDRDGVTNADEAKWGTDALDPNSRPTFGGGNWTINF